MADSKTECPPQLAAFRWKKGESGNPAGRPKKKTFEELVEDLLSEATVKMGEVDIGAREAVAGRLIEMLILGNEKILTAYLDRVWPKVAQHEIVIPGIGPDALTAAINRFRSTGSAREVPVGSSNGGAT